MRHSTFVFCCLLFSFSNVHAADYQLGFPYQGSQRHATLVDADADGTPEILLPHQGLRLVDHDGTETVVWPFNAVVGQPLVGDLEGDGELDVVFHSGSFVFRAVSMSGVEKPGWPVTFPQYATAIFFPLFCLADLDGDGDDELVAFGRVDGTHLHAIDGDGTPLSGWPVTFPVALGPDQALFPGSISAGDIDFDGDDEVAVGLYVSEPGGFSPSPLFVYEGDGTLRTGFPVTIPWATGTTPHMLFPRFADLDGDMQAEIHGPAYFGLHAYSGDGSQYFTPQAAPGGRPGATGDLDGDGDLEIVMPGERLQVFDHNGVLLAQTPLAPYTIFEAVTLGDVNGDGQQEICARSLWENGDWGHWVHLYDLNMNELPGWPKFLSNFPDDTLNVTAIGDLDGDNDLEIIVPWQGVVHVWDEPNPTGGPVSTEWPMWGHDAKRSENYHSGTTITAVHREGDFNGDDTVNLADAISILTHLFVTPSATDCLAAGDIDRTGNLDLADPINLLTYLFAGVPPTADPLGCRNSSLQPLPCSRFQCP